VFLVSLERSPALPVPDRAPFRQLHVMVVRSGETAHLDVPVALMTVLPRAPSPQLTEAEAGLFPSTLRGDILWSDGERFYEKIGRRIMPLRALAAGPRGEVFAFRTPRTRPIRSGMPPRGSEAVVELERDQAAPGGATRARTAATPVARTRCLVRWGDFQAMLSGQIAAPDRLRDSHRLPCCVHVYEVRRPQALTSLAAAILGESTGLDRVRVLDEEAASGLGLAGLLRGRAAPAHARRSGVLLEGQLVFRLEIERDPTAEAASPAAAATPRAAPVEAPPQGKKSIPESYSRPWDFLLSREEAEYDLALQSTGTGSIRSLLRRWLKGDRDARRWRALLAGKTPDEQLWAVRPPRGGLGESELRKWAEQMLQQAGYDAGAMLREWEIYWRRKGL